MPPLRPARGGFLQAHGRFARYPFELIYDACRFVHPCELTPNFYSTKKATALLGLFSLFAVAAHAQPYVPPDFYNEPYKNPIGWFANQGQLIDENGDPRNDILFSSVGCVPKACLAKNSQVHFLTYEHGATPADSVTVMEGHATRGGERPQSEPTGPGRERLVPELLPATETAPAGASQVPGYSRVVYPAIYNAIDLHFYSGSGGQKMTFVMKPSSNPADLQLLFTGQDSLNVDFLGNLRVFYNGQYYILPQAVAYQVGSGSSIIPVNWTASYNLVNGGGVVKFNFSTYDPNLPLVFQVGALPAQVSDDLDNLCWSTYLGGTNGDHVNASTLDAAGNYFVTGSTLSDFYTIPDNPGTTTINGGQLTLLARFHDSYHLDWLTYYGATGGAAAITIREGPPERIYIGGSTYNNNLFTFSEAGAYNLPSVSAGDYSRAFIAKFDVTGALFWSTYFGNGESGINGMDVDGNGRLHIMGYSTNQGIPITPLAGATSWSFTGTTTNTILARFTPTDTINWCTPYNSGTAAQTDGGPGDIKCYAGGFYVSSIAAPNSPVVDHDGVAYFDNTYNGGKDCLLMKFNTAAHCDHITYFGGNADDFPGNNSLAVNKDGDLYFVGHTKSTTGFPLVDDGGTIDSLNTGYRDGFIAFIHHENLDMTWSTLVNAPLYAVCLDREGHVFAVGTTIENAPGTFPVINYSPYYNQSTWNGDGDGVVIGYELGQAGEHLQYYGSYYGGDEGGVTHDQITTTAWGSQRLYLSGITAKGQDVTTFFPLVNPGQPAYFDGAYQFVPSGTGINQNYSDAFVAAICTGVVGITEQTGGRGATLLIGALDGGGRGLFGLPDGQVQLQVFDARGRRISTQTVISVAGRARMRSFDAADGVYIVRAVAEGYRGTARFVVTQ